MFLQNIYIVSQIFFLFYVTIYCLTKCLDKFFKSNLYLKQFYILHDKVANSGFEFTTEILHR